MSAAENILVGQGLGGFTIVGPLGETEQKKICRYARFLSVSRIWKLPRGWGVLWGVPGSPLAETALINLQGDVCPLDLAHLESNATELQVRRSIRW